MLGLAVRLFARPALLVFLNPTRLTPLLPVRTSYDSYHNNYVPFATSKLQFLALLSFVRSGSAAWRALSGTVSRDAMSDPFDVPQLFDVDMDHFPRRLLFKADDCDPLIEGGQAASPLAFAMRATGPRERPAGAMRRSSRISRRFVRRHVLSLLPRRKPSANA